TVTGPASAEANSMSLTYSSYLKLDELLALQKPLSDGPEHDETLFIVIHQVYELWFKQLIHEIDYLMALLETMTPLEFLSFRARLESGSGFQSFQFREMEFVLGHKTPASLDRYPEGSEARTRLTRRIGARTLWDSFLRYLAAAGYSVPADQLGRDVTKPIEPSAPLRAVLVDVYRKDASTSSICERLLDLDEGIQEWRYRHVKMVQRTIGTKHGTGGSEGAAYLMKTLNQPMFPDLWAIRTEL